MFNNETGYHELVGWEMQPGTLWLVNDDKYATETWRLYIIPAADIVAEIEGGPDDAVLDVLNHFCRHNKSGQPTEDEFRALGLVEVPEVLWRFDPYIGYYTA